MKSKRYGWLIGSALLLSVLAGCTTPASTPGDTTPPTVSLATSSTSVTSQGNVTLTATASDNKGVTKVEFYEKIGSSETKLGEKTTAPYTWNINYTATNNGSHSYIARAYDAANNKTSSSAVSVAVNIDATAPTVSLAASSTSITGPTTLTLTATASDDKGVAKVEFYDGTTKLGEKTTAPYTWDLSFPDTEANNGSKSYTAKAFDTESNVGTSSPVSVDVKIDKTAPSVSLAASSSNISTASTLTLTATASDSISGIGKVEFYDGTTKLGEKTTAPYTWDVTFANTAANNGSKSYTVKAFDNAGNNATSDPPVSVTVNIYASLSQIAAGRLQACALTTEGKAYCWGNGEQGQLGNGTNGTGVKSNIPVAVTMPAGVTFSQIASGDAYACALGSDNKAYCWGNGANGRLGNGSTAISSTPVPVSMPFGVTFSQITAGDVHACALGSDNKAYCWGNGDSGQLGNGTSGVGTNSTTPTQVSAGAVPAGVTFSQISAGGFQTCALGSDNNAYCWGRDVEGQLGNGLNTDVNTPVAVTMPASVTFSQVTAGYFSSCARGSDNKTYCWGDDQVGQLGNGAPLSNSNLPVATTATVSFSQISAGYYQTCGLGSDNKTWCWGFGGTGDGDANSTHDSPISVAMPSGVKFNQVEGGYYFTCALGSDGKAYCWGDGGEGQLGNSANAYAGSPVVVTSP